MSKDKAWGDHLTLIAAAEYYGRPIVVLQSVDSPQYVFRHNPRSALNGVRPIRLCHWHENHYGSLEVLPSKGDGAGGQFNAVAFYTGSVWDWCVNHQSAAFIYKLSFCGHLGTTTKRANLTTELLFRLEERFKPQPTVMAIGISIRAVIVWHHGAHNQPKRMFGFLTLIAQKLSQLANETVIHLVLCVSLNHRLRPIQ